MLPHHVNVDVDHHCALNRTRRPKEPFPTCTNAPTTLEQDWSYDQWPIMAIIPMRWNRGNTQTVIFGKIKQVHLKIGEHVIVQHLLSWIFCPSLRETQMLLHQGCFQQFCKREHQENRLRDKCLMFACISFNLLFVFVDFLSLFLYSLYGLQNSLSLLMSLHPDLLQTNIFILSFNCSPVNEQ